MQIFKSDLNRRFRLWLISSVASFLIIFGEKIIFDDKERKREKLIYMVSKYY